jgi:hypothetical protein
MLEWTVGRSVGTFKPNSAPSDIGEAVDRRVLILSEEFAVDLGHTMRCGKPNGTTTHTEVRGGAG